MASYEIEEEISYLSGDGLYDGGLGGSMIPGVEKVGVVESDYLILHPNQRKSMNDILEYDFHYDSKTYNDSWNALRYLNKVYGTDKAKYEKGRLLIPSKEIVK